MISIYRISGGKKLSLSMSGSVEPDVLLPPNPCKRSKGCREKKSRTEFCQFDLGQRLVFE